MTTEELDILLEKYGQGATSPEESRFIEALLDSYVASRKAQPQAEPGAIENTARFREIQRKILEAAGLPQAAAPAASNAPLPVNADGTGRINGLTENADLFPGTSARDLPVSGPTADTAADGTEQDHYNNYDNDDNDSGSHLRIKSRFWNYLGYAAAAVLCLGLGLYFFRHTSLAGVTAADVAFTPKSAFVTPGNTSASLLLSDGKKVPLDSALASHISKIQVAGHAVYLVDKQGRKIQLNKTAGLNIYSSLMTERGQQAPPITLADGTKVWLNAASVLRFPVQFSGARREVELTGEAYFEVAHDAVHPFIVHSANTAIKVLGTHFNVMAYADEDNTYATLLEGAIQVTSGDNKAFLTPGQQGVISQTGNIKVQKVNADEAVAWLHGKLPMDNMDVHAFLREVSRWYDVDISYLDAIPEQTFSGNLNRQVPLENILLALKANGVNAVLKNRTIIISQQ